MSSRLSLFGSVFWLAAAAAGAAAPPELDPAHLLGLEARSIGPAGMSGRVTAIAASHADPDRVYVGAASGGVWKSVDGGARFRPVFDDQPVHSIGAVALFQPNPELVWVGTGEGNPRNSVSIGNGVYKTSDGGDTWEHLGLEASERIHRILLHPEDPEVAWVCALGQAWGPNPERGVYQTVDGGASWRRVLYVDPDTGCGDLALDPSNPEKLYASLWQFRRRPDFFTSGGPGSGLYLSRDGGQSWRRLDADDGLPPGPLGRIGIAVARSDPRIVYALVEAERSALLRSEDGGSSWRAVNRDPKLAERPFYFADLRVDPARPERLYSLGYEIRVSDDGGRSFHTLEGASEAKLHVDHHALWIHPHDPEIVYDGSDGGFAASRDGGKSFRFAENLPLAQIYHLALDRETPYHVYVGLQDNGSWRGPSAVWERGGIRNHHWRPIGDGDGFDARPDPEDASRGYSMWQGGQLHRFDLRTGEERAVKPAPVAGGPPLRFNWSAGFAVDPFDPATIYLGSQYVHRSRDRGETWEVVSPDLTTDDPQRQRQAESGGLTVDVTAAENYTTITAIAPSPLERGLLWVGTDDGRLHRTRDGGESWTSLEDRLPEAPRGAWIPHLEASPHAAATAFVVLDDHRRADFTTYAYRTDDGGRSWRRLGTEGVRGWAHVIVEDPFDPDLLYLGTELGLWLSRDGGRGFLPFRHGLPAAVAVTDLAVHPRDGDLVVATHGRGVYVVDDPSPLRRLTPEIRARPLHLFPVSPAQQHWRRPSAGDYGYGVQLFRGANRPYGALLDFWLDLPGLPDPETWRQAERRREERRQAGKRDGDDDEKKPPAAEITVTDAEGKVVRRFEKPVHRGLNRAVWNLARDPFAQPPWKNPEGYLVREDGPEVPPGVYRVRVRHGEHESEGAVEVLADPRSTSSPEDWQERWRAALRAGRLNDLAVAAIRRVQRTYADLETVAEKLRQHQADAGGDRSSERQDEPPLVARGREIAEGLRKIEAKLWISDDRQGIPAETDVVNVLWYVDLYLLSSWAPPSPTHHAYLDQAGDLLAAVLAELDAFYAAEIVPYRAAVEAEGVELLPELPPLAPRLEEPETSETNASPPIAR